METPLYSQNYSQASNSSSNAIEAAANKIKENTALLRPACATVAVFSKIGIEGAMTQIVANKAKFALEATNKEIGVVLSSLAGANLRAMAECAASCNISHEVFVNDLATHIEECAAITFGRNEKAHPDTFRECAKIMMDTETYSQFSLFDLVLAFRHAAKAQFELYTSFSASVFVKTLNSWNDVRRKIKSALAACEADLQEQERKARKEAEYQAFKKKVLQAIVSGDFIRQMLQNERIEPTDVTVSILRKLEFSKGLRAANLQTAQLQRQAAEYIESTFPETKKQFLAAFDKCLNKTTGVVSVDELKQHTQLAPAFIRRWCRLWLLHAYKIYDWNSVASCYSIQQEGWQGEPIIK